MAAAAAFLGAMVGAYIGKNGRLWLLSLRVNTNGHCRVCGRDCSCDYDQLPHSCWETWEWRREH